MCRETHNTNGRSESTGRPYRVLPLLELVQHMLRQDAAAWLEFHNRALFPGVDGTVQRLAEFLGTMSHTYWAFQLAGGCAAADRAYDGALARFLTPDTTGPGSRRGTNSLRYLRAVQRLAARAIESMPYATPAEQDVVTVQILRRCVMRSLRQACEEAHRKVNPARSRYIWRVAGGALTVWLPVDLPGCRRREWLLEQIPDADPRRPGEKFRVQAVIDQNLGQRAQSRLDCRVVATVAGRPGVSPPEVLSRKELADRQLPELVADEKAASITWQRPAIRALGPTALQSLVLAIFDGIAAGRYDERKLARQYGLSAATMTRFAGSRWDNSAAGPPPDLFLNLTHVVATDNVLIEAAQAAGVWPMVDRLANAAFAPRLRRIEHAG